MFQKASILDKETEKARAKGLLDSSFGRTMQNLFDCGFGDVAEQISCLPYKRRSFRLYYFRFHSLRVIVSNRFYRDPHKYYVQIDDDRNMVSYVFRGDQPVEILEFSQFPILKNCRKECKQYQNECRS